MRPGVAAILAGSRPGPGSGLRYPLAGGDDLRLDAAWGVTGTGQRVFSWMFDLLRVF